MNAMTTSEKYEVVVKEMKMERAELGREIRAGNYRRAAGIARYISDRLLMYADLVKDAPK